MQAFISTPLPLRPRASPHILHSSPHTIGKLRRSLRAHLPVPSHVPALPPSSVLISMTTPLLTVGKFLAGPCINLFNLVMVVRIILTWYPQTDLAKAPWIYLAVPTEPLLKATRKVVPPVGGVDISPIVWFAIMSFVHEILVGPQGLLILLEQK
eukprot:GFKZ01006819.1.p1 GENE.GFKZ01006819.1~~GFKZ01006819.1.p1  ORF type:complete len:154 (+),score=16.95 GFKZ01006819.1:144-605(+)